MLDVAFVAFDILRIGTYEMRYSWSLWASPEDKYLNVILEDLDE